VVNKIITELYEDADVNDCISKFVPKIHRDDFKQELFLRLLEYPDSVLKAYKDGKHKFYTVRIILSLISRERDIYHKKYKAQLTQDLPENYEYCEPSDYEVRKIREDDELKKLERIGQIETLTGTCYYRLLIMALEKHKTYREVSRQTGIPVRSISNAMKRIRKILND